MNQPEYLSSPSYHLTGKVIRGRGIGKLIGTPTADIQMSFPQEMPPTGVYISTVIWNGAQYASVTNVGKRPTIDSDAHISVETLILDFQAEIYESEITIHFLQFMRLPIKFNSLSDLREQIFLDCQNARDFFRMPRLDTHTAPDRLPESIMQFGILQIDTCQRSVSLNGREIALTTREYDALLLLASHPGRAYSKEQIYEGVWHEPSNEYYHSVENLIYQLRKKLKSNAAENSFEILTMTGYGYKFVRKRS